MTNRTLTDWTALSLAERRELGSQTREAVSTISTSHAAFISEAPEDDGGVSEGLLAHVPFSVKDNIDVAGMATTAGTPALRDAVPAADNGAVSILRAAGAIVVGKTNLHELALGITSTNTTFGHVRNPFDLARAAGGSSGGSAVSVALGAVPFALGTDTGGSVTIPASMCGIAGFRPTTGRYPGDGVVQISSSRDTIGIHANNVRDIETVDEILCPGASTADTNPSHAALSRLTLGVPAHRWESLDEEVAAVCRAALDALERAGVTLVDVAVPAAEDLADKCGFGLVFFETVRGLDGYARQYGTAAGLGFESIAAQVAAPDVRGLMEAIAGSPVPAEEYARLRTIRARLRRAYADTYADSAVDAFVFPTTPVLPPPLGVDDVIAIGPDELPLFPTTIRHTNPGTVAGVPMLSVPAGRTSSGLPVGLAVEGRFHRDRALLGIGRQLEDVLA